jgi:hypothetical protein
VSSYERSKQFRASVFVRGTGSREFPEPRRGQLEEQKFWVLAESARAAAGARSIFDVSSGGSCKTSGWPITLSLTDWRDVDAAIAGLGSWLRREGLSGEVVLWIEPVPKRGIPI